MLPRNREKHSRHFLIGGSLAPGTVVGDGATVYRAVPLNDYQRCRFRPQCSAGGGTFAFHYARPDENGEYVLTDVSQVHADAAAADVVVVDTTEGDSGAIDLHGEGFIIVAYTDDGGGSTIGYVAFAGLV